MNAETTPRRPTVLFVKHLAKDGTGPDDLEETYVLRSNGVR
jgi:hypothetical protein